MSASDSRCEWCLGFDTYIQYHDTEWGVPVTEDRKHFEFLTLEGAQAGLSWATILKKRSNYRKAFDSFEVEKIALYDTEKINKLLKNEGIVRNKLKINSVVNNARHFLSIQQEYGSFNSYIWDFVGNKPIQNEFIQLNEVPASTDISDIISKDLKKRGFKFVGSTIMYAYMQACGLVNDHIVSCPRWKVINKMDIKVV